MNKRIKIFDTIYIISFYAILFCILFLKWYNDMSPDKFLAIVTPFLMIINFGRAFVNNKSNIKIVLSNAIFIVMIIGYSLLNIILTDINTYASQYLIDFTLFPFFTLVFVKMANEMKSDMIEKYIINPSFWILNIYNIINFFIILKQISIPGFMVHNFTTNTFYKDMINGLLGVNGASKLTFLYLICLYLSYYNFNNEKKYIRVFAKVFFAFTILSSIYASLFNDNRTYYFLLIMFMFPLIMKKSFKRKINAKKMFKGILLILIISVSFFCTYKFNESFRTLTDDIIKANVTRTVANFTRSSNGESGGEERVELLRFALNEGNGYTFGKGIGILQATGTGEVLVPEHFGLNDCNVRIFSGGLIFLGLILIIYTNTIYQLLNKKNKFYYVFILGTLAFISVYNQAFTYCEKTFLIAFTYFLLIKIENKKAEMTRR